MKMVKTQTMNESRNSNKRLSTLGRLSLLAFGALCAGNAGAVEVAKLLVSQTGLQRVTYEELEQAGVDLNGLQKRNLFVRLGDSLVRAHVQGQSQGAQRFFGAGGYIDFYAQKANSLYTDSAPYQLHYLTNEERKQLSGTRPGRMLTDNSAVNITQASNTVYTHTAMIEENNFYDFAAPSEVDPWHYGQNFSIFPTPTYSFDLNGVAGGSATAELSVEMYGLLDFDIEGNDHHYAVKVNDVLIGDQQFDGNSIDTYSASNVAVQEGQNTFQYEYRSIAGVPFDIVTLNRFSVRYPRIAQAIEGYLEGEFGVGQAAVTGIDDDQFVAYRIGENGDVTRMEKAKSVAGQVLFNNQYEGARYVVASAENAREVMVKPILREQDITTGTAQYLIITDKSLMGDALDELVALRSQRYSVKVVDIEQVYAQFGDGVVDSKPIHDYIKFAAANMEIEYVTFVGNDNFDYKNRLDDDSFSLIPTRYVTTPGGQLIVTQTPSDAAYGDLNGDLVSDLPVGRITVRNQSELQNVVNKLKAYETRDGYAGRVLVAADKEDTGNGLSFTQDAEALIAAMPKTWRDSIRSDFRAYPDVDGGQLAHEKTLRAINAGVSVVNFIGHSSHRRWSFSSPPILESAQIADLTNFGKPALVTQWGCWNSYFVDPAGNTMADSFLLGGENGAVTVVGASTLTSSAEERAMGVELNKRMYTQGVSIGKALIAAKQALAQREDFPAVQLGLQIIGDPAVMVNP